jgi:hypothetical protein
MQVEIKFKTPDAVEDAIRTAVYRELVRLYPDIELDEEDPESWPDEVLDDSYSLTRRARKAVDRFVKYGEVVTIVVNVDAQTATVVADDIVELS